MADHAPVVDFAGGRGVGRRVGRPVFLDGSGTRRRVLTAVAAVLGCGVCAALTLLVLAFAGASPVTIAGFPQSHPITNPPSAGPGAQAGGALPTSTRNATRSEPGRTPSPTTTAAAATATPSTTKPGHQPSHTPPHPTKSK